jgi:UDP-glucose 4-epimerase
LLDQGFSVTVVDDNRTGKVFYNHDSVEYHQCDVVNFNPHMNSIEPPVAIFHLANSPRVRRALEYPTETIVNNISSTCAVADWARIFNCKLFFSTSSSTQYKESQGNPYTFSKVVCESTLDMYRRLYSLDYVLMFYYNVYGPGEADYGEYSTVVRKFKMDYLQGKPLTVYGTGKKERDFTHVDDVVQGILQLLADPNSPSVAHFGSGSPRSISSIADCFEFPVVHSFDRPGEAERTYCQNPYIESTHDVHNYIKQWVQENKNDATKNSSR